jgi:hypothetical protein
MGRRPIVCFGSKTDEAALSLSGALIPRCGLELLRTDHSGFLCNSCMGSWKQPGF